MKIAFSDLCWTVRGREVLRGISLDIASGEFVSLLGPNGCGKTSLLRCLYRLHQPTSGVARLGDADVWKTPPRQVARDLAVITQAHTIEFDFTVVEMVRMGRIPHHRSFERTTVEDDTVVEAALRECRLENLADRTFSTLSGGERQRTLIARAVAQQPRVLLMDEPTNHLDIRAQIETLRLARNMGITVLAAIHDLSLAARFSDRVAVLAAGRVVADGPPAEVLTSKLVQTVYGVEVDVFPHPRYGHLVIDFKPDMAGDETVTMSSA